jgi:predicted lactoylglutathione lyase
MPHQPAFVQLNLVSKDMAVTLAFYRRLGLVIEADPGDEHVEATLADGVTIEWDSEAGIKNWDASWAGQTGGSTVLGFRLPAREAVDEVYANLTRNGGRPHQPPYDAFFGARYAIVDDPDGNPVGLMSPITPEHRHWPPRQPPTIG